MSCRSWFRAAIPVAPFLLAAALVAWLVPIELGLGVMLFGVAPG
jgi:hypothetical protein